jgi:hypothetical protein
MLFDTAESEGLVDRKWVRSWESKPFLLVDFIFLCLCLLSLVQTFLVHSCFHVSCRQ